MAQRQEETVGEIKHVVKGQEHQRAPCQTKASLARYYAGKRPAFEYWLYYGTLYGTRGEQVFLSVSHPQGCWAPVIDEAYEARCDSRVSHKPKMMSTAMPDIIRHKCIK